MNIEILTRAAKVLERSVTLENQTLAAELLRFDTAQREALARVEVERNELRFEVMTYSAQFDTAQAKLAEAVGLLQKIEQRMYGEDVEHRFTDLIPDIDRITAQFEPHVCDKQGDDLCHDMGCPYHNAQAEQQEARAALATQPAAGEPVYQWKADGGWIESSERGIRIAKEKGHQTRILWTAPPAAAHGDEAVRKLSWKDEHEAFKSWARSRITPLKLDLDEVGLFYDEVAGVAHDAWHARAAMRAQGDGEVQ